MNSVIVDEVVTEYTLRIRLSVPPDNTFEGERTKRWFAILKTNTWVDGQGKRHSHVYIIAEHIEFKVH